MTRRQQNKGLEAKLRKVERELKQLLRSKNPAPVHILHKKERELEELLARVR